MMEGSLDAELVTPGKELGAVQLDDRNLAAGTNVLPAILTSAGDDAVTRFIEYFTAHIRNKHTRRAYFRNATRFLGWCEDHGIASLKHVKPVTVAVYIELLQDSHAKPTVKQHLATI